MAKQTMTLEMTRLGESYLEAKAGGSGGVAHLDGPPDLGGKNQGMRPMELFLASLAGCSAMDVIHIMKKQRQDLKDLRIRVTGVRADAVPAVYEEIELVFEATGAVDPAKLESAVQLSMDKYCSVRSMLKDDIKIRYSSRVVAAE